MPASFNLLEYVASNSGGFRFIFWKHRKHQGSNQLTHVHEFNHLVMLDHMDSKKRTDISRNSTVIGAVPDYFQKRTRVAYASSQGETQTTVRRMDKFLWLSLVLVLIFFFLSLFPEVRVVKTFFLCFNIYIQ